MGSELRMRTAAALGALWLSQGGVATAQAGVAEVRLRDASGAPVAEAVVSLHPLDAGAAPSAPAAEASMDQRNKQFAPHVLAVRAGSAVRFPNSDQIRHHVYSFSEAKRFELRLYHGVPADPVVFERAGTVVLGCNIHDDMIGFVRVVDTPWFATSDAGGLARIQNVPAGRYRAELWHARLPSGAPAEQPLVLLDEGAPTRLEVTLVLGPEPQPPRPRRLLKDRLREDRGP